MTDSTRVISAEFDRLMTSSPLWITQPLDAIWNWSVIDSDGNGYSER